MFHVYLFIVIFSLPSPNQNSFFKIQVPVTDIGGTFPFFENPFFPSDPLLRMRNIGLVRGAPGLKHLFPSHADQDLLVLNMLLKVRIKESGHETPGHCEYHKQKEKKIYRDPNTRPAKPGCGFRILSCLRVVGSRRDRRKIGRALFPEV